MFPIVYALQYLSDATYKGLNYANLVEYCMYDMYMYIMVFFGDMVVTIYVGLQV